MGTAGRPFPEHDVLLAAAPVALSSQEAAADGNFLVAPQALVALLRYVLTVLAQPVVSSLLEPACTDALYAAVSHKIS